ncbi:MAG: glycosyltransferase [Gammaproteobacteria bacterium]|nr:glycosyltransferase [Gammaproteobacteria bacterium]
MDLVSIVVPIYNTENYLRGCIESILSQSYKSIDLILVDDGSKDGSLALCDYYKRHDDRVRVISKQNTGVSDTRNVGAAAAEGTYICFVDSDDVVKPTYVETLLAGVRADDVDVAFCNFEYLYENRRIPKEPRLASGVYTFAEVESKIIDDGTLSGVLFGSAWMGIYKKSIIDSCNIKFNPDIKINEDGIFNIEYCMQSKKIRMLSEAYLYEYRRDSGLTKKVVSPENIFAPATKEIRRVCEGRIDKEILDKQISARRVSESMWMVLLICSKNNIASGTQIIWQLKKLLNDSELRESYASIAPGSLKNYKAVYYWLMKLRMYRTLLLLTKYVFPVLSGILSR